MKFPIFPTSDLILFYLFLFNGKDNLNNVAISTQFILFPLCKKQTVQPTKLFRKTKQTKKEMRN